MISGLVDNDGLFERSFTAAATEGRIEKILNLLNFKVEMLI